MVGVLLLDEGSTATTDKAEGAGGAGAPTRRARLSIVCRDAEVPRCWVARNRLLKSNPLVSADLQAFREVLRWGATACHAERSRVRIPSAASKRPACAGLFRCSSRAVRLRHRTMTRQSCPRQLADAGRNASRQDGLPRIARKYQGFRQGTDSQDGGDSGRQAVVPPSRVGESPQFANFSWATRRRRRRWRVFQEETRSRKAFGDRSCALAPSGLGSDRMEYRARDSSGIEERRRR
jgi:hypothetical protein